MEESDLDLDLELAREITALKAIDLGVPLKDVEKIDEVLCAMLNIIDPDPLSFLA